MTPSERQALRRQLYRELGFDELTRENCAQELFGDFDLVGRPRPGERVRVVQTGPGRRDPRPANEPQATPDPEPT
ncbi:hypothetical protein PPSIR1_21064 [Plesiocystis pacifica SIR-1]|uniref:Uncharacterized protein n=1 Tax=Plesiocystis pacifica SIR-1 TaxID=391625 RepID=A6G3F2_9BACT|nr:hypothetical protein [Plesiocystis pacifica]EDM79559.1 hypothetical protein PPSIR1_21064 [Plesiocystis pacifica SIR-1]